MLERIAAAVLGLSLIASPTAADQVSRAELFREWRSSLHRAADLDDVAASAAVYRSILDDAALRGEEGILVARAADALADLHRKQRRFDLAAPLYERSTSMLARLLGPQQPRVAVSFHNLGVCYVELAEWEAAERALNEASAIWRGRDATFWLEQTEKALRAAREHRKIPWRTGGVSTLPR